MGWLCENRVGLHLTEHEGSSTGASSTQSNARIGQNSPCAEGQHNAYEDTQLLKTAPE